MKRKFLDFNLAKKIHSNFYDYSKVINAGSKQKVLICCPNHGDFLQSPYSHIVRKQGCRKCQSENNKRLFSFTIEDFVKNAKKIHGNKYDYNKTVYVNSQKKVSVICPLHGVFTQTPANHVNHRKGCPSCKSKKLSDLYKFTTEEFVKNAVNIHGKKYDYSKVNYVNMGTDVTIICNKHGPFQQRPSNHIHLKNGCPSCGYNVSIKETEWLDSLDIPSDWRQRVLTIDKQRFKVDAYDKTSKIVYEFFGHFWHGNPEYFDSDELNPKNGKSFGELYQKTLDRIKFLESRGFKVIQKWG